MTVYDDVKCPVCAVPHEAYHQVESALLRAVEVLGNIRAPVPVPLSLIDEILSQARAALGGLPAREPPPPSPPPPVHEGQALLVAVGNPCVGAVVLATIGEFAAELLNDAGGVLGDVDGWHDPIPVGPGLHVWEGSIHDHGMRVWWSGAWRPMRAADLARFGLAEMEGQS